MHHTSKNILFCNDELKCTFFKSLQTNLNSENSKIDWNFLEKFCLLTTYNHVKKNILKTNS